MPLSFYIFMKTSHSKAVHTASPQGYRIKGPMIPKHNASPVIRANKVKQEEEEMEREMMLADGRAHGHF